MLYKTILFPKIVLSGYYYFILSFPLLNSEKEVAVGRERPVFICRKRFSLVARSAQGFHLRDNYVLYKERSLCNIVNLLVLADS